MQTATGPGWELRCCDCRDPEHGLAAFRKVDHVITDPPYSERTHAGQEKTRNDGSTGLASEGFTYQHITREEVEPLARMIARSRSRWALVMTDSVLHSVWEEHLDGYTFAPIPIVQEGSTVRLTGDGPACWAVWLVVNRAIGVADGAKPGAYVGAPERNAKCPVKGTKPLWLMERLLRDYTQPGDVVADPFAGSGTTGVACVRLGRLFVGWEREPKHFEYAVRRLRAAHEQMEMFA